MAEVYWRTHKVGKTKNNPILLDDGVGVSDEEDFFLPIQILTVRIPDEASIRKIAQLDTIIFDEDFKELFGLSGRDTEPYGG